MNSGEVVQSKFANALRTQKKSDTPRTSTLPCPFPGHHDKVFHGLDQLYNHARADHASQIEKLDPRQARAQLKENALRIRRSDQSSDATAGDRSTPDITGLSLEPGKDSGQPSPPSSKKRPAESEHQARRGKAQSHVEVADTSEYSRQPYRIAADKSRQKPHDARLFDPNQPSKGTLSPYQTTPEPSSEWSHEARQSGRTPSSSQPQSPARQIAPRPASKSQHPSRQPGLLELQKYDSRYPGLLLQPDSRPISQEQLASEVKSIYAALTMVETKCIHITGRHS